MGRFVEGPKKPPKERATIMIPNWLNRWRVGGVAAVLTGALLAALLTTGSTLPAREEAKPSAQPIDLAKIPGDGMFFASVRVADLWESKLAEPARQKLAKEIGEPAEAFEKYFGLPLQQVERLTIFIQDPMGGEPLLFMHGTRPYERAKILATHKNVQEQKYKDQTFYSDDKEWSVYFLDDRSLVYGHPNSVKGLIDHPAPKDCGNLAGALEKAAGKHSLTVGFNVQGFNDAVGERLPGEVEPFKPLLQATSGSFTVDVDEQTRIAADLTFPDEKKADAGLPPLKSGRDLAVAAIGQGVEQMAQQKGMEKIVELTKQLQGALKAAQIEQKGKTLQASAGLRVDVSTVGVVLLEAVQKARSSASRVQSANNLKQIGLAMHNYADTLRILPAQAIYDKNGKPMLSWRVLILPYVEQQALYNEFHLNEPWDSEHNKKLLAKMPKLYASPYDENTLKDHTTYYQGFFGKGCFFEGKQGLSFPRDFPDGLSNTIMVVEASKAVPWTKPEDIPYDPAKPLPKLGLPGLKGFNVGMCDGSVHFLSETITEKTLRNAITRNDGNPLGPDF
jgi:hypothetical protein